jgi:hypothetical protein
MQLRLLQRHLHTHIYCSAIHNSQVTETDKMPITDEWIKKMWYLYTMESYSAIKRMKSYHLQVNGWNWST